jgi:hypothetical protein
MDKKDEKVCTTPVGSDSNAGLGDRRCEIALEILKELVSKNKVDFYSNRAYFTTPGAALQNKQSARALSSLAFFIADAFLAEATLPAHDVKLPNPAPD